MAETTKQPSMSAYASSIGEPEGSQDTPMRNTTPMFKRQRQHKPRPGQPKKTKMNQCQTLATATMLRRVWEDIYDPLFDKPSGKGEVDALDSVDPIKEMDDDLGNGDAYIRDAKKENDELHFLIQELQSTSKAAKQSNDNLDRELISNGITFGDPQVKPVAFNIPDYDEHRDDQVVEKSNIAHSKREDDLRLARDSIEKVRQQVQTFNGELGRVRAELAAQIHQMQSEYESKLSEQQEHMSQRAQKEKQELLDEATRSAEIANNAAIEHAREFNSLLARKEYWKGTACHHEDELKDTKRKLNEKVAELKLRDQELESNREVLTVTENNHRTKEKALKQSETTLRNSQNRVRELERVKKDKFKLWVSTAVKLRAKTSENQRLMDRALVMEKELTEQREVVNNKVHDIWELEDGKAQLEGRNEQLSSKLGLNDVELKKNSKTINSQKLSLENIKSINQSLVEEKNESNKAMARLQRELSNMKINSQDKDKEMGYLREDNLALSKRIESTSQRLVEEKNETQEAMAKLQRELYNVGINLNDRHMEIGNLREDNLTLSNAKVAACRDAAGLKDELRLSKLELESMKNNLSTQASLHETELKKLLESQERSQIENEGLRNEKACAETNAGDIQKTLDDCRRELGSFRQNSVLKDKEIKSLQTTNAELGRMEEKLNEDKGDLQHALDNANSESKRLQADLELCRGDLQVANGNLQHERQNVEEVRSNLAAEKRANRTASLETLLKSANIKVETISQNLSKTKEFFEDEKSANSALRLDIDRLGKDQSQLSQEKTNLVQGQKELEDKLALEQDTIRRLEAEAKSNAAILGQSQQDRSLLESERAYFLQQLMAESSRMYRVTKKLPKELVGMCDTPDLRILVGIQAGKPVLVRAQRGSKERKGCLVIESEDRTRVTWHKNFDECKVDMAGGEWYLRLEEAPNEAAVDVTITEADPYDLMRWFEVSN